MRFSPSPNPFLPQYFSLPPIPGPPSPWLLYFILLEVAMIMQLLWWEDEIFSVRGLSNMAAFSLLSHFCNLLFSDWKFSFVLLNVYMWIVIMYVFIPTFQQESFKVTYKVGKNTVTIVTKTIKNRMLSNKCWRERREKNYRKSMLSKSAEAEHIKTLLCVLSQNTPFPFKGCLIVSFQ